MRTRTHSLRIPRLLRRRRQTGPAFTKRMEYPHDSNKSVWHRSGPNRTERARRVFYAQYSLDVIRAAPSDPRPLSLAVPCLPPSPWPTSAAPAAASACDERDGDGDVGARSGKGERRLRGEVEPPPGSRDGVDGDGRRQRVEDETAPSRPPLSAAEARTSGVSAAAGTVSPASSDVVDGAAASRRRRRPGEEGARDADQEEGGRGNKRSRG